MKRTITITDLTRMGGDRVCIAGYTEDAICIRPQFRTGHITEDWLTSDEGVMIYPFAVVEFDLQAPFPDNPHTEDWMVDWRHKEFVVELEVEDQQQLLAEILDPNVKAIFGAPVHRWEGFWVRIGEGNRSLGTIFPRQILNVSYNLKRNGNWDYRMSFIDQSRAEYTLAVVDLAFRNYMDLLRTGEELSAEEITHHMTSMLADRHIYLRIGLARGWKVHPDRCYLQVTGVHTFPDYLEGRCFAELR